MRRKCISLAFLFLAAAAIAQTPQTLSSVPSTRLAHIRRGINLSEWFAQVWDPKGYTKEHFLTWNTTTDIALIKSMGFDHVRLSINPQPMMDAVRHPDGTARTFRRRSRCRSRVDPSRRRRTAARRSDRGRCTNMSEGTRKTRGTRRSPGQSKASRDRT